MFRNQMMIQKVHQRKHWEKHSEKMAGTKTHKRMNWQRRREAQTLIHSEGKANKGHMNPIKITKKNEGKVQSEDV